MKRYGLPSALLMVAMFVFADRVPVLASPLETAEAPNPDMSGTEFASMSCLIGAGASGAAAILIGSVAIVVTGGTASAAETAVAVPVLIATASAGCSIGGSIAPALTWMRRESGRIVSDIKLPRIPPKPIPLPERSADPLAPAPADTTTQAGTLPDPTQSVGAAIPSVVPGVPAANGPASPLSNTAPAGAAGEPPKALHGDSTVQTGTSAGSAAPPLPSPPHSGIGSVSDVPPNAATSSPTR